MKVAFHDRVRDTTQTIGTGSLTLDDVAPDGGFKTPGTIFTEFHSAGTTYVGCWMVTDDTDFEVFIGTYTDSTGVISKDTMLESTNSNAAVNWGAGTKDVYMVAPGFYFRGALTNPIAAANLPDLGANASVVFGPSCVSDGTDTIAIGDGADAGGSKGIAIGKTVNSPNEDSVSIGSNISCNSGGRTVALGRDLTAPLGSAFVWSPGQINSQGDTFLSECLCKKSTTDATPTIVPLLGTSFAYLQLPDDVLCHVDVVVMGVEQGTTNTFLKTFKDWLVYYDGITGTEESAPTGTTVHDDSSSTWAATVAITSGGQLRATVTGAAATNIDWTAWFNVRAMGAI